MIAHVDPNPVAASARSAGLIAGTRPDPRTEGPWVPCSPAPGSLREIS